MKLSVTEPAQGGIRLVLALLAVATPGRFFRQQGLALTAFEAVAETLA